MGAYQIAWVGKSPNLAAQVDSRLPKSGGVKGEPLPWENPVKIDVNGSADSVPSRM